MPNIDLLMEYQYAFMEALSKEALSKEALSKEALSKEALSRRVGFGLISL